MEHAVTEMVTGLDLVEMQLRIAAEPLGLGRDVPSIGHAIEARLYAEDPTQGFLPQSGTLASWKAASGAGVRIDHALRAGMTIPSDYDPLPKIGEQGVNRRGRRRLRRATSSARARDRHQPGVPAAPAAKRHLRRRRDHHTDFVEPVDAGRRRARELGAGGAAGARCADPVGSGGASRQGRTRPGQTWSITVDDGSSIVVRSEEMTLEAAVDRAASSCISRTGSGARLRTPGTPTPSGWTRGSVACYRARTRSAPPRGRRDGDGELRAPMAAQVVAVAVAAGDRVEPGAALVTLRAGRAGHRIAAPRAALVREVLVREGDQVAFRQVLIRLEEAAATSATAEHGAR